MKRGGPMQSVSECWNSSGFGNDTDQRNVSHEGTKNTKIFRVLLRDFAPFVAILHLPWLSP